MFLIPRLGVVLFHYDLIGTQSSDCYQPPDLRAIHNGIH